jgi:hypothetical protein
MGEVNRVSLFPPPLLSTWHRGIQVVLAGVVPIAFGLLCGALLSRSATLFLALQVIGIAGGYWAGLEHAGPRSGAARGVLGGLLFGTSILVGHRIEGGSAHGVLPDPEILQLAITTPFGALLGLLGARARRRIDRAYPVQPPDVPL